ncbi:acyl-CoA carboxylase subunit epsilon [Ornithinicoccus hortensis]|uniref:acyl-CoA carboxylase subunit epsilon n=1 Tax=Ornithinicoccus hortensis TaxID=82346 RepID=UPI001E5CFEF6|nr:acyl-CoA carboxylase subunit epsilon [Ornithinicoccus hortensis]
MSTPSPAADQDPAATHPDPPAPTVRIEHGRPTAEESAALVAVLTALGTRAGATPAREVRSLWNSHARAARPRLSPGPGAWRSSGLPR